MKRLFTNFIYLSILQGINYLLPLLTLPYLITVIGISKIGLLAFISASLSYLQILINYGFNLSATRAIAIHSNDKNKINEIYSAVISIQLLFILLSSILIVFLISSIPFVKEYALLYSFTFAGVIGQTLFPSWYFQGIQEMKYVTILNVIAKLFFTLAVFVLIKQESDYIYIPLLASFGYVFTGLGSLLFIHKKFKTRFIPQPFSQLKKYIKEGWHLFISSLFGALYRNTNVLILGLFSNTLFVGYYSVAEKIFKAIQSFQNVVGTTLFPFVSKQFHQNGIAFLDFLKKKIKYILLFYGLATSSVLILADQIIKIVNGKSNWNMALNLKILSIVILIGGLNYVLGILGLIPLNYKKVFSKYIMITGMFNIFICSILVYYFHDIGASFSQIASELLLLILIGTKILKINKKNK